MTSRAIADTSIFVANETGCPLDTSVAEHWTKLRVALRDRGLRMGVNDSWIAATALELDVPVLTQDDGFPTLDELRVLHA